MRKPNQHILPEAHKRAKHQIIFLPSITVIVVWNTVPPVVHNITRNQTFTVQPQVQSLIMTKLTFVHKNRFLGKTYFLNVGRQLVEV